MNDDTDTRATGIPDTETTQETDALAATTPDPTTLPPPDAGRGQVPPPATWNAAEWHGKMLVDRDGERLGKLVDVYVDIATDEPKFATVREGFFGRHLTFVPLAGIRIGPDDLQVSASKELVRSAPNLELHGDELTQADESALYHHFEENYTPLATQTGRRLARR